MTEIILQKTKQLIARSKYLAGHGYVGAGGKGRKVAEIEVLETIKELEALVVVTDEQNKMRFLHRWLHFGSPDANGLNVQHHNTAFALCDGYGNLTVPQLVADGLTWDWSHVRDSSPEAIDRAINYLRKVGCK